MSIIEKVEKFNKEIIGIDDRDTCLIDENEHKWLSGALLEEKEELDLAFIQKDFVAYIDALVDSTYFAIGGLVRCGLPSEVIDDIFSAVHNCNMRKVKGKKKREVESELDAIKLEDWVDPEQAIMDILDGYRKLK